MPFLTKTWSVESTTLVSSYRLTRALVYEGKHETFTVPVGFVTDYASVPRIFTWLFARDGIHTPAAILHDYLCEEAYADRFSRRDADGIFRRVLREAGVDPATRWSLWTAVRVGGMARSARLTGHLRDVPRGIEWLQVVGLAIILMILLAIPALVVSVTWLIFSIAGRIAAKLER